MTAHFNEIPADAHVVKPVRYDDLSAPKGVYALLFKRLLDTTLVLLSAPLSMPLIGLIALLSALDGHNPFFVQKRVGRGGRVFNIIKMRTMVPNADMMLDRHLQENADARAEWDATQKLKDDPRITAFGRILRKTSMDELPQLWNVLMGDMSLVGPRPILPEQQGMYTGAAYYTVRPGITGPWQVSARNECEFRGRAKFDGSYARNLSFKNDMILLMRTIRVVLKGTGY